MVSILAWYKAARLRNASVNEVFTAFHQAYGKNDKAFVLALCRRFGARKDIVARNGRTLLMYAAERGDNRAVKALVRAGADMEAVDSNGNTAMVQAARFRQNSAANVLIALGAKVGPEILNSADLPHVSSFIQTLGRYGENQLKKELDSWLNKSRMKDLPEVTQLQARLVLNEVRRRIESGKGKEFSQILSVVQTLPKGWNADVREIAQKMLPVIPEPKRSPVVARSVSPRHPHAFARA